MTAAEPQEHSREVGNQVLSRQLRLKAGLIIVPLLLTLVASNRFYRSKIDLTSPWKGGSFGMFSTLDLPQYRFAKVYLGDQHGMKLVDITVRYQSAIEAVKAEPRKCSEFASFLVHRRWVLRPGSEPPELRVMPLDEGQALPPGAIDVNASQRVKIEIWRYGYDSKRGAFQPVKLAEGEASKP